MHRRLSNLYETVNAVPLMPDVLPQALIELGSASEIVHLATEELYQQNEELIQTRTLVEAERQRYQDLFEFAPEGYLVTDAIGTIQEANRAAAELLNIPKQYLTHKPMSNFVALHERHIFRSFLIQLSEGDKVTELVVRFQKRNGEFFDAACTVGVVRNEQGKTVVLRWLVRDITERKQVELALLNKDRDLSQNRLLHKYCKGETILLNRSAIWYVRQGVVKLSTLCETGEEILVGLAGEGMVFGSSMTSLQIYQATALSNVEVVSIYVTEIAASATLSHTLLPKINQRLRQTESFLVISGRRRVEDRLYHLLQLFKQEIGEAVSEGTRLKVRLTHEELASACCTTRVTITRLMGKLQKQNKISFDSKNHIILLKDID